MNQNSYQLETLEALADDCLLKRRQFEEALKELIIHGGGAIITTGLKSEALSSLTSRDLVKSNETESMPLL